MPIHAEPKNWILETANTAYVLGINPRGLLTHRYWGPKLPYQTDYPAAEDPFEWASFSTRAHATPEEYPGDGGGRYGENCLKVVFADGVRDLWLRVQSATMPNDNELHINLTDVYYSLQVTLRYRVHTAHDLIERSAVITNTSAEPITLERVWSAQWHLPGQPSGSEYWLSHTSGRWLDEMHIQRDRLTQSNKVLESRRLTPGHHHNPWFAVDRGDATEKHGEVWFGVLAWSGNWKISAEENDRFRPRISIGINDWDFAWTLNAGESFATPSSIGGYTQGGFTGASHALHNFIRDDVLPHKHTPHKVLYNSWEATFFNVGEHSQGDLAVLAAQIGVELFVVDDGWFHNRNLDNAGLGDWWPDAKKFPNGLGPLIKRVNGLGMDFGLWIEPEMVNPDSDLYRAHPDWVLNFPTRQRTLIRSQLILNFARQDVQDYIFGLIDKLLTENNIAFIKWDMNRNVTEPGWPDAPQGINPREVWVRYVQGLYAVWDKLRAAHPDVIWQSCSGGGGRADVGILQRADQVWISDNTEATARLGIQYGYSHIFPANTMEAWVTDLDKKQVPLSFRFHVSMCGSLGIGGHLLHWTPEERAEAAKWVAFYKDIREIVQLGDQYRLRAPDQAFSSVMYMNAERSEGVLFAFRTHLSEPVLLPPLFLRGLRPEARYEIEGFREIRSGAAWMQIGLKLHLSNFSSTVRHIWQRD